jgi:hypothetical protein
LQESIPVVAWRSEIVSSERLRLARRDARNQAKGAVRHSVWRAVIAVSRCMDTSTPPGRAVSTGASGQGGSRCSYGLLVLGGAICGESDDPATAAKRDTSTRERFERRIEVVLLGPLGPMGDPTWTRA